MRFMLRHFVFDWWNGSCSFESLFDLHNHYHQVLCLRSGSNSWLLAVRPRVRDGSGLQSSLSRTGRSSIQEHSEAFLSVIGIRRKMESNLFRTGSSIEASRRDELPHQDSSRRCDHSVDGSTCLLVVESICRSI